MIRVPLLGASVALALVPMASAQEATATQANLAYKAIPKWAFVTPAETWTPVGTEIPIPHSNGRGFAAEQEVMTLSVDTDGDGQVDKQVKGTSGYLELRGKGKDGKPFTYAARFTSDGKAFSFSSSGAMVGQLKGVQVRILDLNNNGIYNEIGKDGLVVGGGQAASFLSKVVHLNNELHTFEVSADGTSATATPFQGETGTLDLRSGFKSNGNLDCAVVSSADGTLSFNLAQAVKGLALPVGTYRISGGQASKGGETVRIGSGTMAPIAVAAGKTVAPAWGGAVVAEFDFARSGEEVTVQPNIKYFGRSGEEYHTFKPDAKSPKFVIEDASKPGGKPVASGRFGGC
jgi:hypothetical protein